MEGRDLPDFTRFSNRRGLLKVANVHLEGGRYEDAIFKHGSRRAFMRYLLQQCDPDIVIGDFNVSSSPTGEFMKNYEVFRQFGSDEERSDYLQWLAEPHRELAEPHRMRDGYTC